MVTGVKHLRFALFCIGIGGLVYGVRYFSAVSASHCENLCKYSDHTARLNEKNFRETVVPLLKSPRPFNLIVFVDPDRDCLACLFETEFWLAPMNGEEDYRVHFFIPSSSPRERVDDYIGQFLLEEDQVIRFDHSSSLSPYHGYGVLKVFYDLEEGVRWFEFGNEGESEQKALMVKIGETIASLAGNH